MLVETKNVVEGEINLRVAQIKSAYDELESLSAKVKMWVKFNRTWLIISAIGNTVGFIFGAVAF